MTKRPIDYWTSDPMLRFDTSRTPATKRLSEGSGYEHLADLIRRKPAGATETGEPVIVTAAAETTAPEAGDDFVLPDRDAKIFSAMFPGPTKRVRTGDTDAVVVAASGIPGSNLNRWQGGARVDPFGAGAGAGAGARNILFPGSVGVAGNTAFPGTSVGAAGLSAHVDDIGTTRMTSSENTQITTSLVLEPFCTEGLKTTSLARGSFVFTVSAPGFGARSCVGPHGAETMRQYATTIQGVNAFLLQDALSGRRKVDTLKKVNDMFRPLGIVTNAQGVGHRTGMGIDQYYRQNLTIKRNDNQYAITTRGRVEAQDVWGAARAPGATLGFTIVRGDFNDKFLSLCLTPEQHSRISSGAVTDAFQLLPITTTEDTTDITELKQFAVGGCIEYMGVINLGSQMRLRLNNRTSDRVTCQECVRMATNMAFAAESAAMPRDIYLETDSLHPWI